MNTTTCLSLGLFILQLSACSSDDSGDPTPKGDSASIVQPIPDGGVISDPADTGVGETGAGVCCPATLGGCALPGGYSPTGVCPALVCDHLCNARIVDDVHGCKKMVFDPCSTIDAGPDARP